MRALMLTIRPWSFTMTAVSVTAGSLLAKVYSNIFDLQLYAFTLLGVIFAHAATNLLNDYFDVQNEVDKPGTPTAQYRPHPILTGELDPDVAKSWAKWLYFFALVIGFVFFIRLGWPIALLAVTGFLASYFYTGGFLKYKYRALGEVSVFLMWGPLMMLGSFFVQTGSWDHVWEVLWVSFPIGIWVALVLLANNLKDIEYDKSVGIKTLGTQFGREGALAIYSSLVLIIYLLYALVGLSGVLPIWSLVALVTFPKTRRLIRELRDAESIPPDADPKTAKLGAWTGIWLILSLLLVGFVR
ncbi:prenyltransferase [Candidatus Acetothermia bacterium]|nr:prenyltransferase [Candidatus Acetothermia bacterium]MBI3642573.1 prenyltransferase [Candidatus Acetothermia bacterium]